MRQSFFIAVLILIAIKVAMWVSLGQPAIVGDAHRYWDLSTLALSGDVLLMGQPIAYRMPFYPWFIAIVRLATTPLDVPLQAIVILQAVMYVATAWLSGLLAEKITKLPSAKFFTALAMLPAISAVTYVGLLVTETFFVFLLTLHLLSVVLYEKCRDFPHALFVGATFGVLLLTRPVVLLVWIAHLILLLSVRFAKPAKNAKDSSTTLALGSLAKHCIAAIAIVALIAAPWLMRNHQLFGRPFITEFLGRNIWIVTFQEGSGAGLELPDSESTTELKKRIFTSDAPRESVNWRHTWTVSHRLTDSGLSDADADVLMKKVAIDAMKGSPRKCVFKSVRRIVNFWRCPATDLPGLEAHGPVSPGYPQRSSSRSEVLADSANRLLSLRLSQSVWMNTMLLALIVIANVYVIWHGPTRHFGVWVALILGYFSVITGIVEVPDYRYRMVTEPLSATIIGCALSIMYSKWQILKSKNARELSA